MVNTKSSLGLPVIGEIRGMLKQQKFCCAITGNLLTPDNTTGNHIIPLSRTELNPKTGAENAWLVDKNVNKLKSNLTYDELLTLAEEIAANKDNARQLIETRRAKNTPQITKDEFAAAIK